MRTPDYLPLCSIAGWDPTCGAGAGADLRVFSAHGAHGSAAVTTVTAQGRSGVAALEPVRPAVLRSQLQAVAADPEALPRACKVGLLADAATVQEVWRFFGDLAGQDTPIVVDPVLRVSAGGWAAPEDAVDRLRALITDVMLVTPNAEEARRLAGLPDDADPRDAARALLSLGVPAVLLTDGDGEGEAARDWLLRPDAIDVSFELPRVAGGPFHGTGCALSSAIAVRLAQGHDLENAIRRAKQYVHALLALAAQTEAWLLPHLAVRPS